MFSGALEATTDACFLHGLSCRRQVLTDPASSPSLAPRPNPPVVCSRFGLDKYFHAQHIWEAVESKTRKFHWRIALGHKAGQLGGFAQDWPSTNQFAQSLVPSRKTTNKRNPIHTEDETQRQFDNRAYIGISTEREAVCFLAADQWTDDLFVLVNSFMRGMSQNMN